MISQNSLFSGAQPAQVEKRNYPFQAEAIQSVLDEFKRGVSSTALIMATGTGKTFVFAQIAKDFIRRTDKPALIVAHRIELVEQISDAFKPLGIETAKEQGNRYALNSAFDAVIACTPTLKKPERLTQFSPDFFSLIVTDECHHAVCADNRKIYDYFSGTPHLGVTATPLRSDRVGLKNVFQTVAFQYPIQQGIEEGYLCRLKGRQIKVQGLELENINSSGGDFSKAELDALLMRDEILSRMVIPTMEHADDRPTIVFAQDIAHARAITECFNRNAGREIARHIDSQTEVRARRQCISGYRNGDFQFIVNVGVLTEGFDHPPTACIALFRPTKSLGLLAQMIGRGTRTFPEGAKTDCLVLDFVGAHNSVRVCNYLDVLDGTILTDREHFKAQEYIDRGYAAIDALVEAKNEIAKLEAIEITWKALSQSNPFDIMKLFAVPSRKGLYGGQLATHPQRSLLELKGIKTPPTLERGEAAGLLNALRKRTEQNLASFKQLKKLKSLGYKDFNPQTITRSEAHKLISKELNRRGLGYLVKNFESKAKVILK